MEVPEATQLAELCRDGAVDAGAGKVEHGEEGEVAQVRGERSDQLHVRQHQGGHALPVAPAA